MSENLTVLEIRSRFDSEWVLVANPRTDKANNVQSGTVLAHSRNRDEVDRQAVKLKPRRCAMRFTGVLLPKDTAIVL